MAISRMQEPRQLYGLGSLVRKITRPIKKAVKGVSKIAKSPLGKLAILGGLGAYGFGAGPFQGMRGSGFLRNMFMGAGGGGGGAGTSFLSTLNPFNKEAFDLKNLGFTVGAAGAILPFVAPNLFAPKQEEMEEIDYTVQPAGITSIVEQAKDYYRKGGGGNLEYMPRRDYVIPNFYDYANGGRVGLSKGGDPEEKDIGIMSIEVEQGKDDIDDLMAGITFNKAERAYLYKKLGSSNTSGKSSSMPKLYYILNSPKDYPADAKMLKEIAIMGMGKKEGGRVNFDSGGSWITKKDKDEDNGTSWITKKKKKFDLSDLESLKDEDEDNDGIEWIKKKDKSGSNKWIQKKAEGGLMDLGGREMDLRADGGFIPIGSKEKADDVPARLSKNEFVMKAEAVRGAGGGSIERGAQKMYNTMKQLESKVA